MVTVQVQRLIDFVAEVFSRSGSSPEEARRIATYLTTANLTGHDSHGVIRVPVYIRCKKMGSVVPDQTVELVVDTPSLAVVDGKFGYGQTVAPQAVKIGIEKCKAAGLSAVALRNPSRMVIVCVISVPHISLTLPLMIVPSCGLASCVQRDAARASRS